MSKVVHIESEAELKDFIESNTPCVLDLYAQWCGPCKQLKPKIDELSNEFPAVKVGAVDIDQLADSELLTDVNALPTIRLYKNGQVVKTYVGSNAAMVRELFEESQ